MLRTRAPLSLEASSQIPSDLHVLGLPLAFILSQDQTLHCKMLRLLQTLLTLNRNLFLYYIFLQFPYQILFVHRRFFSFSLVNPRFFLSVSASIYASSLHPGTPLSFPSRYCQRYPTASPLTGPLRFLIISSLCLRTFLLSSRFGL